MPETAPNLNKTLQETESLITVDLFRIFEEFQLSCDQAEARTASVLSGVWNALERRIKTIPRRKAV